MTEVAIVGSGPAALTAFATLAVAEVAADVIGDRRDPAEAWRARAAAIPQTHIRSEPDGHVRPRRFPGSPPGRRGGGGIRAHSSARRSTGTPSIGEFLDDVERVRESTGWVGPGRLWVGSR